MIVNGYEIKPGADLRLADLRRADLQGANLRIADLQGADLRGTYLWGANLRSAVLQDCTMNWQSHDLIAERLRQAAGDDPLKRMAAGYVLMSRDWCWNELIANAPQITLASGESLLEWALSEMRRWVRDGDEAPGFLTNSKKEESIG